MSLKNKTSQKLIPLILIIFIIVPAVLFSAQKKTSAQDVASDVAASATCIHPPFTGGPAFGCPSAIGQGKTNLWTSITSFFTNATSITSAASAGFDAKQWKEVLLEQVLKGIARKTLQQMTQSTVNWINTGFHGAPLFLERPGSFFKDIAKSEIKNMVSTIGYDNAKYPFGKSTAIGMINTYKSTFEQNAQYSLSKVTNDPALLKGFREDFSVGGWDAFFLNTQYPQNNYIGFQMLAADELSQRNTGQSNLVKDALSQGQGFLSPQTCPSNPQYNNLKNQFQQPSFKPTTKDPILEDCDSSSFNVRDPQYQACLDRNESPDECYQSTSSSGQYQACLDRNSKAMEAFNRALANEKKHWEDQNSCPGGLVNTTPGSVVGASIMKAVTGPYDQTSLAAAMGNSLSAVFDALLNKFMSSGLNALSNKARGAGTTNNTNDNFDYYGNTLGTDPGSNTNTGFNWGGPDEIIVLSTFKKDVQNAIDNGNRELKIIDGAASAPGTNNLVASQGILQVFETIWPKTQELDTCLPGPNRGWESRLNAETQRSDESLQVKMSDPDASKASRARAAHDELKSATSSFKNWITTKINTELPGSKNYLNAVNSIQTINDQNEELIKRENTLVETLVKLESIKSELNTINTEPSPRSAGEASLIRLKQRYNEMVLDIPTTTTVNDAQNKLDNAKAKLLNVQTLINRCEAEKRTVYGDNVFNNPNADKERFCSSPIIGGYSHTPFMNRGTVTHPAIPLVNATNVYQGSGATGDASISIVISCDTLYRTDIADYKKSAPSSI